MSIRSGRGPRDQAHPMEQGSYEGADLPSWRATDERGSPPPGRRGNRNGTRGRVRIPGFLKFLVFAGVLGAVVVVAGLTAFRPLVAAAVTDWAWDNPGSMRVDFVADLVRDELGEELTAPAGTDGTEEAFEVAAGDTPQALAPRLQEAGFIASQRAFIFAAVQEDLAPKLQAGLFVLRRDMTPAEVVDALVKARIVVETVELGFREQLRLEQLTAKLQTIESNVDPQAFYDLATHPTPELLADYPWLQASLPEGRSLEGFLYPATYTLVTAANGGPFEVTTAEGLVRMMLDRFEEAVHPAEIAIPETRGLTFYQIIALASIVEREAVIDEEKPLIAGVYQNRLAGLGEANGILNADPTVVYAFDTLRLREQPFEEWQSYFFWDTRAIGIPLADVQVSEDLLGYQTYQRQGLIPGPICTPTIASIDAALAPDTADGFVFFLAKRDGSNGHAFARNQAEHDENRRTYGY